MPEVQALRTNTSHFIPPHSGPLYVVLNAGSGSHHGDDDQQAMARVFDEAGRPVEFLRIENPAQIAQLAQRAVEQATEGFVEPQHANREDAIDLRRALDELPPLQREVIVLHLVEGFSFVEELVAELKAQGTTILIATHQLDRVDQYADFSLVLEAGRVQSFTSAKGPE